MRTEWSRVGLRACVWVWVWTHPSFVSATLTHDTHGIVADDPPHVELGHSVPQHLPGWLRDTSRGVAATRGAPPTPPCKHSSASCARVSTKLHIRKGGTWCPQAALHMHLPCAAPSPLPPTTATITAQRASMKVSSNCASAPGGPTCTRWSCGPGASAGRTWASWARCGWRHWWRSATCGTPAPGWRRGCSTPRDRWRQRTQSGRTRGRGRGSASGLAQYIYSLIHRSPSIRFTRAGWGGRGRQQGGMSGRNTTSGSVNEKWT